MKLYFYGAWGTGKTLTVVGLLKHGFKVLVVTTDVGGSGTTSVKLSLRQEGHEDLLDNLYEVVLNGDDEVQAFLSEPATFFPDIYAVDPDFLMWDGFSSWQQVDLSERIGGMPMERARGKEISDAVESGLQFETPQWGMMRNATFRAIDRFCGLHNRATGKVWHKIVTSQEGYKSKGDNTGGFSETKMPLVQGAGGILMGGAFDLIIRTVKGRDANDLTKEVYKYQIQGEGSMSKNRGFKLPAVMDGDSYKLWSEIQAQLGIQRDSVDKNLITEKEIENAGN